MYCLLAPALAQKGKSTSSQDTTSACLPACLPGRLPPLSNILQYCTAPHLRTSPKTKRQQQSHHINTYLPTRFHALSSVTHPPAFPGYLPTAPTDHSYRTYLSSKAHPAGAGPRMIARSLVQPFSLVSLTNTATHSLAHDVVGTCSIYTCTHARTHACAEEESRPKGYEVWYGRGETRPRPRFAHARYFWLVTRYWRGVAGTVRSYASQLQIEI